MPASASRNEDRQEIAPIKNNEAKQNPAQKEKSMLDRLKFWEDDEKPIEKAMPPKKEVPEEHIKPEAPKVQDTKSLPAETAPNYFDLMLEKIGF